MPMNGRQSFPERRSRGRGRIVATIRGRLDDPAVRVVALSGAHMMGKSREALEATRVRDMNVVEALDRNALSMDQIRRLEVPGREPVVLARSFDVAAGPPLNRWRSGSRRCTSFCGPARQSRNSARRGDAMSDGGVDSQQIVECCAWDRRPPRFLIHDRDCRYGATFAHRVWHLGIEQVRTLFSTL